MGINFCGEKDRLIHVMACDDTLRGIAVQHGQMAAQMVRAVDAGPLAAEALCQSVGAVMMMAALLKDRQQVGLQINGDGPLGEIYAVSDARLHVRASIAGLHAEAPSMAEGIGTGRLKVIRKLDEYEPAYTGIIELEQSEIAGDLARYFVQSEQIPTALALGETLSPDGVTAAGGFLIQALPGVKDRDLDQMIERIQNFGPLSQHLDQSPEAILKQLLPDHHIVEEQKPCFYCPCSRELFARRLVSLGEKDLRELADEEQTEVLCHFCGTRYQFDQQQMRALLLGAQIHDEYHPQAKTTK